MLEPARVFYNNFEVAKVAHFLRPDVRNFTDAVRRGGGIFQRRWGDAIVRYMQVALFARPDEVYCFGPQELAYCHQGCCVVSGITSMVEHALRSTPRPGGLCCDPCPSSGAWRLPQGEDEDSGDSRLASHLRVPEGCCPIKSEGPCQT